MELERILPVADGVMTIPEVRFTLILAREPEEMPPVLSIAVIFMLALTPELGIALGVPDAAVPLFVV